VNWVKFTAISIADLIMHYLTKHKGSISAAYLSGHKGTISAAYLSEHKGTISAAYLSEHKGTISAAYQINSAMYKYICRLDISLDHSSLAPPLSHSLTPSLISRLLYSLHVAYSSELSVIIA